MKIVAVLSAPPVKMRLVLLALMSKAKIPGTEAECNPGCEAKVLNLKSQNVYLVKKNPQTFDKLYVELFQGKIKKTENIRIASEVE